MRSKIENGVVLARSSRATVRDFLVAIQPKRRLEYNCLVYLNHLRVMQLKLRKQFETQKMRKQLMRQLWQHEVNQMIQTTENKTERLSLQFIHPSVRDAIIHKWIVYCKQVYVCKVLIIRKTLLMLGYPNAACWAAFWKNYRHRVNVVDFESLVMSKTFTENLEKRKDTAFFFELSRNHVFMPNGKPLEECPPLLDPELSSGEAKELHIKWCGVIWKPECLHSEIVLDGVKKPQLPSGLDNLKLFYRNLARDMPIQMEFVPSVSLLRKFIKRGT